MIIDGRDIYGDGVNVAARLEKLADPGGVCISGIVFDQVKGKLDAGFEEFGFHHVKNIADPVRTYRVTAVSVSNAQVGPIATPTKPSIAVLPFDNMSDDHAQEYFSDGISEDLTTALSRFDWLFVIARNSAFTYKGKAVDVKKSRTRARRSLSSRGERPAFGRSSADQRAADRCTGRPSCMGAAVRPKDGRLV